MPYQQGNGEEAKMRTNMQKVKDFFEGKSICGCELGVDVGNHAREILMQLPNLEKLFLVDSYQRHHKYSPHFESHGLAREKLAQWKDKIEWILWDTVTASLKVVKNSLDFVYVDADHSTPWCLTDCRVWWPKLKRNGILCGHDFSMDSVQEAVAQFAKEVNLPVGNDGQDWWIFKEEK